MPIRVRPVCDGVASKLKTRSPDPTDTIDVGMAEFALGSPEMKGSRYLSTFSLASCIAVGGHRPSSKVGFMSHITNPTAVEKTLSVAIRDAGMKNLLLYGGDSVDGVGAEIVARIYHFLLRHTEVEVQGRDLLRGPEVRSHAIALDTLNGEYFKPDVFFFGDLNDAIAELFKISRLRATDVVEYCGGRVAPLEVFLELARRN